MAIGLGAIFLLIGILIPCGIPYLSLLGTTGSIVFSAVGALMLTAGAFLRCVQESDQQDSKKVKSKSLLVDDPSKAIANNDVNLDQGYETNIPASFAQITADNYESKIETDHKFNTQNAKHGDLRFVKKDNDTLNVYLYLSNSLGGMDYGCGVLNIENGKFVHKANGLTLKTFSNLKEFLNYFFEDKFLIFAGASNLEFVTLKSPVGKELYCSHPFKM